MTLSGSLADLEMTHLLRYPVSGPKTGELLIAGPERDARLYYVDGVLVHVAMDDFEGQEALTELIGWSEGNFEFRRDVLSAYSTFRTNLERAITLAIKERNERSGVAHLTHERKARIERVLERCIERNDFVKHIGLVNRDCAVISSTDGGRRAYEGIDDQRHAVCSLAWNHPGIGLRRVLLSDVRATVAASPIADDLTLMVVADPSTRFGAVSLCLDRLVNEVAGALGG